MVFLVPDGRHMLLSAISDGGMRRISILAHGVLMRFRRLVLGAFSKAKNRVNRIKSRSIDYKIEKGRGRILSMNVSDVLFGQMKNTELFRYDVVVRYLAICD